jgi:hypothetical protein
VSGVLQRFDTDNPYLQRLFGHELFGVVPDQFIESQISLSPLTPTNTSSPNW